MTIDYEALFAATPSPYLVLSPDLMIRDVNEAYLEATVRTREELVGRHVFEAFPDKPHDPNAAGAQNLRDSLERVIATGRPDSMAVQRYDILVSDGQGHERFEERYWSPVNTPVLDAGGNTVLLIHRVEDVTSFVLEGRSGDRQGTTDLIARARELQELNQMLREAHAREREVALSLQEAMLPTVGRDVASRQIASRYRPAMGSLNVCGDWYDITDLGNDQLGIAVGDVVGHGLTAAGVMGQLRAGLVAATSATGRPDRALEVLDRYARSIETALGTTAVKVVADLARGLLTYSSAGHPPPLLLHQDGAVEALDRATGPPLAATLHPVTRHLALATFAPGDRLALYTDGLIERRHESIALGIERLGVTLQRYAELDLEDTADAIIADLVNDDSLTDDIALVLVAL